MKRIARRTLCCLLLLALLAAPALADLQRGDRGDEVRDLQQLLFESGWLFELPDGIYGRNTEEAVRNYQRYAMLPQTGVADDETIARLRTDWALLTGRDYEDPSAVPGDPPVNCVYIDAIDQVDVQYCGAHQELARTADSLIADGSAESAAEACRLWEQDIDRQYDVWMQASDPQQRLVIATARASFRDYARRERAALETLYTDDPLAVNAQMETILREQAVRLCEIVGAAAGE